MGLAACFQSVANFIDPSALVRMADCRADSMSFLNKFSCAGAGVNPNLTQHAPDARSRELGLSCLH
jgi:hypothetical protein